MIDLVESFMDF